MNRQAGSHHQSKPAGKARILSGIFPYIAPYKTQVFLMVLMAFFGCGAALAAPYVAGLAIDRIAGAGRVDFGTLGPLLGCLGLLYGAASIANWLLATLAMSVASRAARDMRRDAFRTMTQLPLRYFDNAKSGDIMSRFTNDIDAMAEGLTQTMTQFFSGVITIAGALTMMLRMDFWIALAVIVVTPMAIWIASFIARHSARQFRLQQAAIGEYNSFMEESIGQFNVIKAFGYEAHREAQAKEINHRLYQCGQKAQFYSSLVNPSTRFINNTAYMAVGLIGGLSAVAGGLSIGMIASLLAYSAQFAKPLNEMTGIITQLQAALAAAERFLALMDEKQEPSEADKPGLAVTAGTVDFSHIAFAYEPARPLIQDFSVSIPPGCMVAIVGPTGAGKTTLVNLLMRFYNLNGGYIAIDGKDIKSVNRDSLRLSFGMVLQDTWLFTGTVRDNIAFGKPDATEEEVIAAAKAARAHGFIKRLPQGYHTLLTSDGSALSQGEKQLLTIARAMLANPPMMILDEATSSVDPRTELKIQDALQKLMQGKTSFVIAHRLSTIQDADLILVMDQGAIIETGSHQQLLAKNGFYAKLYHSQFHKSAQQ